MVKTQREVSIKQHQIHLYMNDIFHSNSKQTKKKNLEMFKYMQIFNKYIGTVFIYYIIIH